MMADKTTGGAHPSLTRAKRIFLLNFTLFACLSVTAAFLLIGGEDEEAEPEPTPTIPEKEWSFQELAYLEGEMQALSEYPGTMPEYEEAWVRKHAAQAIQKVTLFEGLDTTTVDKLVEEYIRGYTTRFDAYYDTRPAWEFGYQYGIKFNPEIHGFTIPPPKQVYSEIRSCRERLEQTFNIEEEATWRLFFKAFDSGFTKGYRVVSEGVTAASHHDEVRLFDE